MIKELKSLIFFLILLSITISAQTYYYTLNGDPSTTNPTGQWTLASSSSLPSGFIGLVSSGTCPTGTTEVTALNGKTLFGTVAANGDVGGTGGADSITPTVNSLTAAAQTFTGTLTTTVINHTHTIATGTGSTGNFSQVIGTVDTSSGGTGASPTQTTLGTLTVATTGGAANYTPAGTNGTSAVTGTLNSFDNRSAYMKVIFCKAN